MSRKQVEERLACIPWGYDMELFDASAFKGKREDDRRYIPRKKKQYKGRAKRR